MLFWFDKKSLMLSLLFHPICSGILAMPHAFNDSGYVVGVIATLFIGLLCVSKRNSMLRSPVFRFCALCDMLTLTVDVVANFNLSLFHSSLIHVFLRSFIGTLCEKNSTELIFGPHLSKIV